MAINWRNDYVRYKEIFLKLLIVYKKRNDLRMFLEVLLSLITITFFSIFALRPTLLTISQLLKDNKAKEETIKNMEQKIKNIGIAQNNYNLNINKIDLIEQAVPNTPTPETLLRQFQGIANTSSVTILGLSVNEITLVGATSAKKDKNEIKNLPEDVGTITFSVNVTGPYLSLYKFISDLENLRRPIAITSVNLNAAKVEGSSIINMLISGQTPYIKK